MITVPQQIFILFFAIVWGTSANAQPRWKAFDWGNVWDTTTRQRAFLSVLLLNVAPIVYFLFVFWILGHPLWQIKTWGTWEVLLTLPAITAALGVFGFYKLWMGIVQFYSERFYGDQSYRQKFNIYLNEKDLDRKSGGGNIIAGFAWIVGMFALAFSSFFVLCVAFSKSV